MTDVAYIAVVDGYLAKKAGDGPRKDANQSRLPAKRILASLSRPVRCEVATRKNRN